MKEPSSYLRRILPILNHPSIKDIIEPHVDFELEEIHWGDLSYGVLSGGQKTAITWLYILWTDEQPPKEMGFRDPFDGFGNIDQDLAAAILRAFAQRHDLAKVTF